MKNIRAIIVFLAFLGISFNAYSNTTIKGVEVLDSVQYKGKDIPVKGMGVRKMLINLYVSSLYSDEQTAADIIQSTKPQVLKIVVLSSLVSSKKMTNAFNKSFKKLLPAKSNQDELEKLIADFFVGFEQKSQKGEIFEFKAANGVVELFRNNKFILSVNSQDFKELLFEVWFTDYKGVDKKLQNDLLGIQPYKTFKIK